MNDLSFLKLDYNNSNELEIYEKHLYKAFPSTENRILYQLWKYNDLTQRAKSQIPYIDQEIYLAKTMGKIIAGASINYNTKKSLRLELMGFKIDRSIQGICEALSGFCNEIVINRKVVGLELHRFTLDNLRKNNINKIYAICYKNKLRGYKSLGWNVIDYIVKNEQKIYLIESNI